MRIIGNAGQDHEIIVGLLLSEMRCKCGHCRSFLLASHLSQAWIRLRLLAKTPIRITSGYRCQAHNQAVGGKPQSRHIGGEALDVVLEDLQIFGSIQDIEKILKECGFTYWYFNHEKGFAHIDVRGNL